MNEDSSYADEYLREKGKGENSLVYSGIEPSALVGDEGVGAPGNSS